MAAIRTWKHKQFVDKTSHSDRDKATENYYCVLVSLFHCIFRSRSLDSTSRADYQSPASDRRPAPSKHHPPDNIDRIGTDVGLASRPRVACKTSADIVIHTFFSFVPRPVCTSQRETVWWTKSNFWGLFPKSGKDQWDCEIVNHYDRSISLTAVNLFICIRISIPFLSGLAA